MSDMRWNLSRQQKSSSLSNNRVNFFSHVKHVQEQNQAKNINTLLMGILDAHH